MAVMTGTGANQKDCKDLHQQCQLMKIVTHARKRSLLFSVKVKTLQLSNYASPGDPVRKHQAFLSSAE